MSGQNTLLIIAEDAEVKRPVNKWNWQVYRDTAAPGSGTYKAMDFNGVVEIIGGPGVNSSVEVDIEVGAQPNILVGTVTGGVAPYTYLWRVKTNRSNTDFFIGVNSIITGGQGTDTITLNNVLAYTNGLIELRVSDANGLVAKSYWYNTQYTAA